MMSRRRYRNPFVALALCAILLTLPATRWTAARPHASARAGANFLPPGFASRFATAGGVRLHYVIGGAGTPVVLLHGWPATWYEWHAVMPALARRHTVIAPDLPGLGDSAAPACCYTKKAAAAAIHALARGLGYARIDLVGHDIGTMVAYAYAAAHPSEVRRLVLMDAPIPGPSFYQLPVITPQGPSLAWHFGFNAVPDLPEQVVAGRERAYLSYFYTHLAYVPGAIAPDEVDEYVRHYAVPASLRAGFEYYRAFPRDVADNATYARTKLTMPVLALGGDHSAGTEELAFVRPLAVHVSGGAVPNCGHWIPEEQPADLARRLLAFLA
jgi:pimeloyl-ACP methyl ester carboxylesterase